jgi:hypothetical protein
MVNVTTMVELRSDYVYANCQLHARVDTSREKRMSREVIYIENAPRSLVYSQAIKAAGLIFVAGQGPFHPEGNESFNRGNRRSLTR